MHELVNFGHNQLLETKLRTQQEVHKALSD